MSLEGLKEVTDEDEIFIQLWRSNVRDHAGLQLHPQQSRNVIQLHSEETSEHKSWPWRQHLLPAPLQHYTTGSAEGASIFYSKHRV